MSANSPIPSPRSQRAEQAGTVLLYGIFGLLLFGPLAFGTTEPWSIFLMEAQGAIAKVVQRAVHICAISRPRNSFAISANT